MSTQRKVLRLVVNAIGGAGWGMAAGDAISMNVLGYGTTWTVTPLLIGIMMIAAAWLASLA